MSEPGPASPTQDLLELHVAENDRILATIDGHVAQARAAVLKAERDLLVARALLDDALAKQAVFQRSTIAIRRILAHLPTLPDELLCQIFEHWVLQQRLDEIAEISKVFSGVPRPPSPIPNIRRSPATIPAVFVASAVCQRWRHAAFAHATLWAYITLACDGRRKPLASRPMLQHSVRLARGLPLDIFYMDGCGSSCFSCTSFQPAVQSLYSQCGRLRLELGPSMIPSQHCALSYPTPNLSEVVISSPFNNYFGIPSAPITVNLLVFAPRLTHFTQLHSEGLCNYSMFRSLRSCGALTTLILDNEPITTRQLVEFGSLWPSLQHLAISRCGYDGAPQTPAGMHGLRSLHIGQHAITILSFLRREHLPSLEYLALPATSPSLQALAVFLEGREYASLQDLHLCGQSWDQQQSETPPPQMTIPPYKDLLPLCAEHMPNLRILRFSEHLCQSDVLESWGHGSMWLNQHADTLVLRGCYLDSDFQHAVLRSSHYDRAAILSVDGDVDSEFSWQTTKITFKKDLGTSGLMMPDWPVMVSDPKYCTVSRWTQRDALLADPRYR